MAFTMDWANKIVNSDASITDILLTRERLRALEDSEVGILHPPIIAYKAVDLGGGATFPAIEFINGYQLKFPNAGNYQIKGGNLKATVVPVYGVFVDRTQSAAYAVTAMGGGEGGLTPEQHEELMKLSNIKSKTDRLTFLDNDRVSAKNTDISEVLQKLLEIYVIYGMDPTKPLVVNKTGRDAGDVHQTFTKVGESYIVKRE